MRPVALITAAGRGIGAACARELASAGYAVALLSPSEQAERLAGELEGIGMRGDVTVPADLEGFVRLAMHRWGRVDAVVNNTGHPARGDLLAIGDAEWHSGLDLLLLSAIRLARLVTPVMEGQGGGAIVNISSLAAEEPNRLFPVSSVLRAGLGAFTKLYADRYAAAGIRMNAVLPGFVDSHPVDESTQALIPQGRPATVAEVARTVRFLVSAEAGAITGQSVRVDGGLGRSW
jgi:NAD(P)-dependent dehydrogenase (short-subunit alcohol dehydrogenase family)